MAAEDMMDAMPGDMCSISGIVPVTDPINVVIASGGSINHVSTFGASTLIHRVASVVLQSC